jgi:hypothetical protein
MALDIEYLLTATVKVSLPSDVPSSAAVTLKEPILLVITNDPDTAVKSASVVVPLIIVQYSVVPLAKLVVVTLNAPELPSTITVGIDEKLYVGIGALIRELNPTKPPLKEFVLAID